MTLEELTAGTAARIVGNTSFTPRDWGQWLRMWWNAEQSRNRKEFIKRRIDYYEGRQLPYLERLVKTVYEDWESLSLQLEFTNIVRLVVDRLSVIYRDSVRRDLTGNPTEGERRLWDWIARKGRLDRIMDTVNKYVNITGTVLLMPRFNGEHLCFDIITPDNIDIVPDPKDATEAMSISYAVSDGEHYLRNSEKARESLTTYHYWDRESHFAFDTDGIHHDPGNPDGVNPYGILPFARFTNSMPGDSFFSEPGDDMIQAQDSINLKLVELNYLLRMQSFSVPVLIGYDADREEKIVVSPGRPVVIPRSEREEQDADFRFETPNPNIKALMEEINNKIVRLARSYGLSESDFHVSGNPSSGLSLRIQSRHLMNRFGREIPYYEDGEQELFDVIKKVWNYHRPFLPKDHPFREISFGKDTALSVTINKPELILDPGEKTLWWSFLLEKGLAAPEEFYMSELNMSLEEAKSHRKQVEGWLNQN